MKKTSLSEIFGTYFPEYARGRKLSERERSAAYAMAHCFKEPMGEHVVSCKHGHYVQVQRHGCKHRSCPRCGLSGKSQWVDAALNRLLPCAHWHVIFTVPHELVGLWEYNREVFSDVLFKASKECLLQLLGQSERLGAMPGLMQTLHTWGRDLCKHPHIHCLISAGGVDKAGGWRSSDARYLVPSAVIAKLYRGKVLSSLIGLVRAGGLVQPEKVVHGYRTWLGALKGQYKRRWNVRICELYAHGAGVVKYLGRYVQGGPLPAHRRLDQGGGQVRFGYTDHRDGKAKTMSLPVQSFMQRVLWHAPPKGFHTTRYAGLYASARAKQREHCSQVLQQVGAKKPTKPSVDKPNAKVLNHCPNCGCKLDRQYFWSRKNHFSFYREWVGGVRGPEQPGSPHGPGADVGDEVPVEGSLWVRAPTPRPHGLYN